MVFGNGLDLVIVLLLSVVFIKYGGYLEKNLKKPVGFVVAAAMFLLINEVWMMWTGSYAYIQLVLSYVWQVLAFILLLIGGLWSVFEITRK